MRHGSLFTGIGGFDLAAEWMGWENVFQVEIDDFCQKVLTKNFPNVERYKDIKEFDGTKYRGAVDIISGGFPCQPFSQAGKRKGTADNRYLWPEMLRIIGEVQPGWVVGENVRGLTNWNGGLVFDQVQADLEAEGYEVLPFLLPACAVNAPHRRDRIWFVAYSDNGRHKTGRGTEGEKDSLHGEIRQTMDTGEFNGASISSIIINAGLLRQAINEQQAARAEQQSKRIIVESNWDTDEGFNDPDEHFTITHNNIRNRQEVRFQAWWKVDVYSIERNRDAADSEGLRSNRETEYENDCGQSGERRGCDVNNVGEVPGRKVIADSNIHIGCKGGLHQTGLKKAERYIGSCDTWQDRTDWSNFPTQPPICDRNDGLSGRLVGITFPKWRNESIKALGNSIVPQVVFEIFKAIEQYETS